MKTESGTRYRVTISIGLQYGIDFTEDGLRLSDAIGAFKNYLLDMFGGYTEQEATGAWKPEDGSAVVENSLLLFCDVVNINAVYSIQRRIYEYLKGNPLCEWVHCTYHRVNALHVQTFELKV